MSFVQMYENMPLALFQLVLSHYHFSRNSTCLKSLEMEMIDLDENEKELPTSFYVSILQSIYGKDFIDNKKFEADKLKLKLENGYTTNHIFVWYYGLPWF